MLYGPRGCPPPANAGCGELADSYFGALGATAQDLGFVSQFEVICRLRGRFISQGGIHGDIYGVLEWPRFFQTSY